MLLSFANNSADFIDMIIKYFFWPQSLQDSKKHKEKKYTLSAFASPRYNLPFLFYPIPQLIHFPECHIM